MDGGSAIGLDRVGRVAVSVDREESNRQAAQQMAAASPFLIDVRRAVDVVPGMTSALVLTAGPPLPWDQYTGLQRRRILEAAVAEGLAPDSDEVERRIGAGEIAIGSSYQHGCIGPGLALCTASTPVFVVENREHGGLVFAAMTGPDLPLAPAPDRPAELNDAVVPAIREALELTGGMPLQPLVAGALRLGDELHLRAAAATTLFASNLFPSFLDVARRREADVRACLSFLERNGAAWFVRLALAAARAIADAANGVAGSSLVTGLIQNSRECAIRVSGLDGEWFRAPLPTIDGDPSGNPGGDCVFADSVALGDPAPRPRGDLTADALAYWAVKPGIDLYKVLGTGATPAMTAHVWTASGALAGGPTTRPPLACFEAASDAHRQRYSRKPLRS
jgi:hypothetical protein